MATKYGNDAKNFVFASSLLNAQNVLASRQSYSLALALGKSATSVELTGTADSLIKSGEAVPAERLLVLAVERAENSVDYVAALRVLSGLQFQSGRVGEAKASFKRALSVFERYPTDANNQHYFIATGVHTHLFWANAVMWIDCSLARESTLAAGQLASRLPAAAPQIPQMRSEIDRVNGMLANCPP